jgi:hypothetical protein
VQNWWFEKKKKNIVKYEHFKYFPLPTILNYPFCSTRFTITLDCNTIARVWKKLQPAVKFDWLYLCYCRTYSMYKNSDQWNLKNEAGLYFVQSEWDKYFPCHSLYFGGEGAWIDHVGWGRIVGMVIKLKMEDLRLKSWHQQEIFLFSKTSLTGCGAHPASYSLGPRHLSMQESGWSIKLTTYLHLVLRLKMSGSIHLLSLYAYMAQTGTTFPSLKMDRPQQGWMVQMGLEEHIGLVFHPY